VDWSEIGNIRKSIIIIMFVYLRLSNATDKIWYKNRCRHIHGHAHYHTHTYRLNTYIYTVDSFELELWLVQIRSERPLVGTLRQELGSLQLTGEPVMVQRKKKPSGAQRKRLRKQKKQLLPNRLTEDRELEAPTAANRALGLMSILGAAVA